MQIPLTQTPMRTRSKRRIRRSRSIPNLKNSNVLGVNEKLFYENGEEISADTRQWLARSESQQRPAKLKKSSSMKEDGEKNNESEMSEQIKPLTVPQTQPIRVHPLYIITPIDGFLMSINKNDDSIQVKERKGMNSFLSLLQKLDIGVFLLSDEPQDFNNHAVERMVQKSGASVKVYTKSKYQAIEGPLRNQVVIDVNCPDSTIRLLTAQQIEDQEMETNNRYEDWELSMFGFWLEHLRTAPISSCVGLRTAIALHLDDIANSLKRAGPRFLPPFSPGQNAYTTMNEFISASAMKDWISLLTDVYSEVNFEKLIEVKERPRDAQLTSTANIMKGLRLQKSKPTQSSSSLEEFPAVRLYSQEDLSGATRLSFRMDQEGYEAFKNEKYRSGIIQEALKKSTLPADSFKTISASLDDFQFSLSPSPVAPMNKNESASYSSLSESATVSADNFNGYKNSIEDAIKMERHPTTMPLH